jgi:uncharacterized protein (DUF169 family)
MDMNTKKKFEELWGRYFDGADLPVILYYADNPGRQQVVERSSAQRCLVANMAKVRAGKSLCFEANSIGCAGGKRYAGFARDIRPDFEYFLSCGIPGELEGERYKKSPELVLEIMEKLPKFEAPARYLIFKRWDKLEEDDRPDVVVFFAPPDVLSGLFTLANFDESDPNGVFAPFGAGCSSIVLYPYLEERSNKPRCVIGMFDISARPYVPKDVLTFSIPMNKFIRMIENMEESFLITSSWHKVQKRLPVRQEPRQES